MTCARTTGELIGLAMRAALVAQELGTFTAGELAKRVGVSKATAYRYRDEMLRQELIGMDGKIHRDEALRWIGPQPMVKQ